MLGGSGQCFRRFGPKWFRRTNNMEELRAGARPPLPPERAEPGEWQHGWQYHASSFRTFGRRWYLLSRALLTRLTCDLILAQLPARCYTELQQDQSSNWHRISSGRLCWRGWDCPSKCPRPIVNVGRLWTSKVGTVRHVHGPEG